MMPKHILSLLLLLILSAGCNHTESISKGKVETFQMNSEILQRTIDYNVYLPDTSAAKSTDLDIIYLLHGHGGDHRDWFQEEEGNVTALLDSLISTNTIPPLIAVSANAGNSWYVDSVENMESFYLDEFIRHVETSLNFNDENHRYIAGNSAGGYGALRFALANPDMFESVILLSPAAYEPLPPSVSSSRKVEAFAKDGVFNDSIWQSYSYNHRLESFIRQEDKPGFYLSVGDDDNYNIVPVVTRLQQLFLENDVPNELRVMDGGHNWTFWRSSFTDFITDIYAEH